MRVIRSLLRMTIAGVLFLPRQAGALAGNVITAVVQIWANKARSLLTVLGIIIAVTSIITVVSFVQGLGNYFTDFLRGLGTNLLVVRPEWVRGPNGEYVRPAFLTSEDIDAVDAQAVSIRRLSPVIFNGVTLEYGRRQVRNISLRGVNEHFQPIRNYYVDHGRFFGATDVLNAAHVCVLGREVLRRLESDDGIVGDSIHVDGQRFLVVGLLEAKGSFMGDNQDELVAMPWTTAVKMYPEFRDHLGFYVEAASEPKIGEAEGQMRRVLRQRHGLPPGQSDDFRVFKQDQVLQQFTRVKVIATSVLAGIVGISLLVGGIGIMNVMLVSVAERTREIGLRKSVGARRRDIALQFLTEAVVLSSVGGAIGIGLGYLIGMVASMHPRMMEVQVPLWSVLLALGFSAGAGVFFGLVPAFKAAIVHPIDALRHE